MVVCSELLAHGVCRIDLCTASHVLDFFCPPCNIICTSQNAFHMHLAGKKHCATLRGTVSANCLVCPCVLSNSSSFTLEQHAQGQAHRRRLSELSSDAPDPWYSLSENTALAGSIRCDACNKNIPSHIWDQHLSKESHARRTRIAGFQTALRETEKDRHGVEVSHGVGTGTETDAAVGVDFGVVDPSSSEEVKKLITIRLSTPSAIALTSVRLASEAGQSNHTVSHFFVPNTPSTILPPRRTLSLSLYFRPQGHRGHFSDRLELTLHDTSLNKSFTITRPLRAAIGNASDLELLAPVAPYVRPAPRPRRDREENVIEGIKPQGQQINWVVSLPRAIMPLPLRGILESRNSVAAKIERVKQLPGMQGGLNGAGGSGYGRFWETLLHVEEHQAQADLERYDKENVELRRFNSYFYLVVPGLAEKRPSVLLGDSIKVRPHNPSSTKNTTWYIGYVHVVHQNEVGLRFAHRFLPPANTRFDVRFCLNRVPLLRMHQALATAFVESRVLSPCPGHEKQKRVVSNIRVINPLIRENPPQMLAVGSIMGLPTGSPPFVIFGPPGTGKTVTAVEAMLQLLITNRSTTILATAPSNSAADLLARKLLESGQLQHGDLFRLNALSRANSDDIPELVSNSSFWNDGNFRFPSVDRLSLDEVSFNRRIRSKQNPIRPLMDYRVIVATCVSASVPYQLGIPRGHFNWIFVDEAGQACEPEAMIAVKTLAGPDTNIVLSGDPRQLGPVIRSPIALQMGLGLSYLERLMSMPMYHPSTMKGKTVVKLSKNWRNHPAILRYPNERFYANELEACASSRTTDSLLTWSELGRAGFPIIFENIAGQDDREESSPSWFNIMEVSRVKEYVGMLRDLRQTRVTAADIGIIAPYNKQVHRIRKALGPVGGGSIKVGSVEEFQGQERKVIIVSTVRSSKDQIEFDLRHTLGFVANDRRFNVTVTRAQALLIIVGDASVLGLDPLWRSFLSYIHQNGGWKGLPMPWQPTTADTYTDARKRGEAMDDLAGLIERTRTMNLSLGGGGATTGDADEAEVEEGNVDRGWREDE